MNQRFGITLDGEKEIHHLLAVHSFQCSRKAHVTFMFTIKLMLKVYPKIGKPWIISILFCAIFDVKTSQCMIGCKCFNSDLKEYCVCK